ncbi:unnamed protein product [Caenorhabditis sp. 36 PRJEB53466]|nr:unnamed protein product [Caenorhabditis sp. 36 PRJEB53466]
MSLSKQNFHPEVEAAINQQINTELTASYVYLSMWAHFERDDVALANVAKFFKHQSEEERQHGTDLMEMQNLRGGRVILTDVQAPQTEWPSLLAAFEAALALERLNNERLLNLHAVATKHGDAQLTNFLEGKYLDEQVCSINEFARFINNIKRAGPGVGEYIFDKEEFSD